MANTITLTCPMDGLSLKVITLAVEGDIARDTGGDFARDPSQHLHLTGNGASVACPSGHRWRCTANVILELVP